jgi:hypothetical protein
LASRKLDQSRQKWDGKNETGLRYEKSVKNVEYFRDIQPILRRSCVACHTAKNGKQPTGNLNLDADDEVVSYEHYGKFPGTYYRLAVDERAKFGYKPVGFDSWGYPNASRYLRKFQARRSLLVWKIFGERLDGFHNDDHPSEPKPGAGYLMWKGKKVDTRTYQARADIDFLGSQMPPQDAVKAGKVKQLTDEDRRTILRWIDLGCPIDLDYDPKHPHKRGYGWMLDDKRPTLTLTYPKADANGALDRLLVGMYDYSTGLNMDSFRVVADFEINGIPAGENLASKFQKKTQGVWDLSLSRPIKRLARGKIVVSIQDRQGNLSRIERTFSVGPAKR